MNSLIYYAALFIAGFGAIGIAYYLNGFGLGRVYPQSKKSDRNLLGFIGSKKTNGSQRLNLLILSGLCLIFGILAVVVR